MDAALPRLVRAVAKVLGIHVADPAVMRQACQLLDAIGESRYKGALSKVAPGRGDQDYIYSLLEALKIHKDRDDVAWQLLSTMGALVQVPVLKQRLVECGARPALLRFPKQREKEMPRWLEGVFESFQTRVEKRD
jgi:hypothetical protein